MNAESIQLNERLRKQAATIAKYQREVRRLRKELEASQDECCNALEEMNRRSSIEQQGN